MSGQQDKDKSSASYQWPCISFYIFLAMASSNPRSSPKLQALLCVPAQDEKTNGETTPVNGSDTGKENIKDTEYSSNSSQDDGRAEGWDKMSRATWVSNECI